jgi:hypothetical protein
VAFGPGDDLDGVVRERGGMSVDFDQQGGVRLGGAAQFRVREHALTAALLGGGHRLDVEELEHGRIHA